MSEKSKRDLQYEKKRKEREERLKRQREGDAGKEFPPEPQHQFPQQNFNEIPASNNGFRENRKKDVWEANDAFQPNVDQNFAPQTQVKQMNNNQFEPSRNSQQMQGQNQNYNNNQQAPASQGYQQEDQPVQFRKKKQFIQAQVVNQPIDVQNTNVQMNNNQMPMPEIQVESQVHNDQKMQKQQLNNMLQQQMMEKQQQQEREKQQRDMERQKMEEERKKMEIQKIQEQEKERKEQYRNQLQEQMRQKELAQQQQQQFQQQQQPPNQGFQQFNNQIQAQQFQGGMQFSNQAQNQNSKQEYRDFLMNQMQNKNQNQNPQVDKKAQLQQQMEIQMQPGQPQSQVNRTNFGRKNINNMYNQATPMGGMAGQVNQMQQMQQGANQFDQMNQMQRQPIQPVNYHHQQQQYQQQQFVQTPQIQQEAAQPQQFNQFNNQSQFNQQQQNDNMPAQKFESVQQNQSGLNQQNNGEQVSHVRGNRNFMKLENADIGEVNRKQQQKLEYQKELEKQMREQTMKKKQEEERKKREELEEERRVQREQEELKKRLDEEANSKKQQQENTKKENEQLIEQKKKNKRSEAAGNNNNNNNNNNQKSQLNDNFVQRMNQVSKQFLNDEKLSEGIDPRASLMEFDRKKSSQNLNGQQSIVQTPSNNGGATPITPMQQMQQGQNMFGNNMMPQQNPYMQQNPMMYGNQFMMGQYPQMPFVPQMAPMMMNPQFIQQQQYLAKQQADIMPQLYELKLQMQQQQHQIELIKNQANVAIEERNKAEQKYLDIKKQYELKSLEEKKYQQQLQDALGKYHPNNKPHQQIKKDLDFLAPTPGGGFDGPAKYQFHEEETKPIKAFNDYGAQNPKPKTQNNRLDSAGVNIQSQPQINIVKYQEPTKNTNQQQNKISSLNNLPSNNNVELDSNPRNFNENQLAERAKNDYQLKMQQYGMKSLVSDNKFIPVDILDQVKDSQITMSKLAQYGVNGSQFTPQQNHNSVSNLNINNGLQKRPQSYNRSSNDLGNKYDIPSINSDIIKDIDNMMQKNNLGDQYATQQSFYHQNPRQVKDNRVNNENQNDINSYNPQIGFNQNVYAQKPPSRLGSNQGMRQTGREQNNPFGSAARGILGDSKAFEHQKHQKQVQQPNTFKTNNDQEGYNLGSDFPDFSIGGNKNAFGSKGKLNQNGSDANFQASELNFKRSALLKNDNNTTYNNNNTINTNNFDIDKINQRLDDRLNKINQFNIPTVNNNNNTNIGTINNGLNDADEKKFDELLMRYNNSFNVQ